MGASAGSRAYPAQANHAARTASCFPLTQACPGDGGNDLLGSLAGKQAAGAAEGWPKGVEGQRAGAQRTG
jgi:hypothetical protein